MALALLVVRVHPAVMVQEDPEIVQLQRREVFDDADLDRLRFPLHEGQGHVMVVQDVEGVLRALDDEEQLLPHRFAALSPALLVPAVLLGHDFLEPHCDAATACFALQ